MKSTRQLVVVVLGVVIVCGVVGLVTLQRRAGRATGMEWAKVPREDRPRLPAAPVEVAPVLEQSPAPAEPGPVRKSAPPPQQARTEKKAPPPATQTNPGQNKADPPPLDPLAREALSFVGMDLEATGYWVGAINDPTLPAEERKNLIEDLNEDGLPDPKYPTIEDLPLILSRLRLIEQLAPDAMDRDNLEAFAEAYKDLINLADLAMGGGEPVR